MKKELFIPFDAGGNMLDYSYYGLTEEERKVCKEKGIVEHSWGDGKIREVFVPNFEFKDTLTFDGFSRGRSSVKAHFVSCTTGKKYEVFITDLADIIKGNHLINSQIKGTFSFTKRGQNYGLVLLKGGAT